MVAVTDCLFSVADLSTPPFCRTQGTRFCEDFDQRPPAAQWEVNQSSMGFVELTDASAVSAPFALRVSTDAGSGASIARDFSMNRVDGAPASASALHIMAIVRVEALGTDPLPLAYLGFSPADGNARLVISVNPDAGLEVLEQTADSGSSNAASFGPPSPVLPLATWVPVRVDIELSSDGSPGGSYTVTVAGVAYPPQALVFSWSAGLPWLVLGATYPTASPKSVLFDNITVDWN